VVLYCIVSYLLKFTYFKICLQQVYLITIEVWNALSHHVITYVKSVQCHSPLDFSRKKAMTQGANSISDSIRSHIRFQSPAPFPKSILRASG